MFSLNFSFRINCLYRSSSLNKSLSDFSSIISVMMIYRSNEKKNEESATIKSSLMTYFYSYECFRFKTFSKLSTWFINIFIFNVVSFEVTSATIKFPSLVKVAILSTLRTMIVSEWWFWNNQKEEEHFFEDVNSMY
jgi:hypothetical protein